MLKSSLRWLAIVACSLLSSAPVIAQTAAGSGPRISSTSKAATDELRSQYRQDVGDGYTGTSLNQISLANARAQVGNYGQSSFGSQSQSGGGGRIPSLTSSAASKPFSSVTSSPTVSPYLNLFREDFDGGGDFNYQTLVRPQFQQLATNQQVQRQSQELSMRVQSISAQSDYKNPAGSETQYPTGHQTAFGYYGSFYPGMPRPRGH